MLALVPLGCIIDSRRNLLWLHWVAGEGVIASIKLISFLSIAYYSRTGFQIGILIWGERYKGAYAETATPIFRNIRLGSTELLNCSIQ